MTKSPEKSVQKALPFKNKLGFTALPNELFDIYVSYPKFNGNCVLVYMYLLHRFNESEGYAWPTQDQIADATFISRQSVNTYIQRLEKVQLIRSIYNKDYGNNVYVPLKPVSSREEFERMFPEVVENRASFEGKRKQDVEKRGERQRDFRATIADIRAQNQ